MAAGAGQADGWFRQACGRSLAGARPETGRSLAAPGRFEAGFWQVKAPRSRVNIARRPRLGPKFVNDIMLIRAACGLHYPLYAGCVEQGEPRLLYQGGVLGRFAGL